MLSIDDYEDSNSNRSSSTSITGECTVCGRTADAEPLLVSVCLKFL
jgi:hypothetical protein